VRPQDLPLSGLLPSEVTGLLRFLADRVSSDLLSEMIVFFSVAVIPCLWMPPLLVDAVVRAMVPSAIFTGAWVRIAPPMLLRVAACGGVLGGQV